MNNELASVINTIMKDRLPQGKLSEKMNKYHRPENCECLTKVCVMLANTELNERCGELIKLDLHSDYMH